MDLIVKIKELDSNVEKIEQLVEYIIDAMDLSALTNYAQQCLADYYASSDGQEDFDTNYLEMKEIMGDE